MVAAALKAIGSRIARLARDRRGVSAVEFALILPIMLALYFGTDELGNGLTIERKVTHVSSTLSDLVTQATTISDNDMTNILNAAASVATPYSTSLLTIRISELYVDANGKATVQWSDVYNTTKLSVGAVVNIPASLKATTSAYLVTAEIHYSYKPTIGYVMTGTFDIHDQFYLRPRLSDSGITRTSS